MPIMQKMLRIGVLIIMNWLTQLISVPSNSQAITITLFSLCQLHHGLYYYDLPLSTVDWLLFSVVGLGFILKMWTYHTLGKNHGLVTSGPYKYCSHPGCLGHFLVAISSLIFYCPPPYISIPLYAYVIFRFYRRISKRESMLQSQFGLVYAEYKKTVFI